MNKSHQKVSFILLVLLAFIIRVPCLSSNSLWLDEFTSIEVATKSFGDIIHSTNFDSHTPPFYYLLLHFWFQLFSVSEFTLRLFSLLIDIINVVLATSIFTQQFNKRVGIRVGLLICLSPFSLYYAREGRMYTLLMFLVLSFYGVVLQFKREKERWWFYPLLLVISIAGLYTHYYFIFFLCSMFLVAFFELRKNKRILATFVGTLSLSFLAFTPWIETVAQLTTGQGQTFRRFVYLVFPYTFFRFSAGYAVIPLNYGTKEAWMETIITNLPVIILYSSVFILAVFCGFVALKKHFRDETIFLLSPLVLPPLLALLGSMFSPILSERYLTVIYPFFICLLALTASYSYYLSIKVLTSLIFILFGTGIFQYYFNPNFGYSEWRQAVNVMDEEKRCGPVVVNPSYVQGLVKYYLQDEKTALLSGSPKTLLNSIQASTGYSCFGFWVIESGSTPSLKEVFNTDGAQLVSEQIFPLENGVRLYYYRLPSPRPTA